MARKVIIASGVGLRDDKQGTSLIAFLNDKAEPKGDSVWIYPKGSGPKAKFEVSVVFTKNEFAAALDTVDAYVVYSGHSRLGQGPAFGPKDTPEVPKKASFPDNPWGIHFRMGYDATYTEAVGDLLQHSVTPEEYDLTKVSENAFLPDSLRKRIPWIKDVQDRLKRQSGLSKKGLENPCSIGGAWRAFDMCQPELAKRKTDRGDVPLAGRHYYMYIPNYEKTEEMPKGRDEFFVPVKVGSADLDKVSLRCALLVMASCSAVDHYYGPLKRRRQEAKSSCKFMLMVDSSTPSHARNFLDLIFQGLDPLTRKGAVEVLKKLHHFGISVLL